MLRLLQSETTTKTTEKHVKNQYNKKDQERIKRLYQFIDENYQRKIELSEVAEMTNLSEAAFCRYFKRMTRLTFIEFLNHYRVNQAKNLLLLDKVQSLSAVAFYANEVATKGWS